MRRCSILLPVCLFLLFPALCFAWQGKAVSVNDGDYISVLHDGKSERVRLYGVDCPRKHQENYQQAKDFVSKLIAGKIVEVEPLGKDNFGRTVAFVTLDGKNVSRELLAAGFAWVRTRECRRGECREWVELEREAKKMKVGLWASPNPIPPWEFKEGKQVSAIYSGNVVTHVFHASNCSEFNCKSCIVTFKSRAKAVAAGYSPCSQCSP